MPAQALIDQFSDGCTVRGGSQTVQKEIEFPRGHRGYLAKYRRSWNAGVSPIATSSQTSQYEKVRASRARYLTRKQGHRKSPSPPFPFFYGPDNLRVVGAGSPEPKNDDRPWRGLA